MAKRRVDYSNRSSDARRCECARIAMSENRIPIGDKTRAMLADFATSRGKAQRTVAVGFGVAAFAAGALASIIGSVVVSGPSFAMVAMLLSVAFAAILYLMHEDDLVDMVEGQVVEDKPAFTKPALIAHIEPPIVAEIEDQRVTPLRH